MTRWEILWIDVLILLELLLAVALWPAAAAVLFFRAGKN